MENLNESNYQQSLILAGLTEKQAVLYGSLVQTGPLPASKIALEAKLSRPLAYKVLDELVAQGLVEKEDKPGSVARFSAAHPLKLKEITDKRLETARSAKDSIDDIVGKLTSDFNLQSGKPGVRFFEGREGALEILEDSLNATEEIYTYVDTETVAKYAAKENEEYVQVRIKRGISKKILTPDTPFGRKRLLQDKTPLTEWRLLRAEGAEQFNTAIEIYNGRISYLTFSEQFIAGTLIQDPSIYKIHRYLFENAWQNALSADQLKPPVAVEHPPASQ